MYRARRETPRYQASQVKADSAETGWPVELRTPPRASHASGEFKSKVGFSGVAALTPLSRRPSNKGTLP